MAVSIAYICFATGGTESLESSKRAAINNAINAINNSTVVAAITVSVDLENNAEVWWDAARASSIPTCVSIFIASNEGISVVLRGEDAVEVYEWAEGLDGWDDGDEHAPHPLCFE